jgi:methyl-accepting chemotaxis protein
MGSGLFSDFALSKRRLPGTAGRLWPVLIKPGDDRMTLYKKLMVLALPMALAAAGCAQSSDQDKMAIDNATRTANEAKAAAAQASDAANRAAASAQAAAQAAQQAANSAQGANRATNRGLRK